MDPNEHVRNSEIVTKRRESRSPHETKLGVTNPAAAASVPRERVNSRVKRPEDDGLLQRAKDRQVPLTVTESGD